MCEWVCVRVCGGVCVHEGGFVCMNMQMCACAASVCVFRCVCVRGPVHM